MQSPPPLPRPSAGDHRVRVGTVVAALAKLNIEISIEDLLNGVREVEEANRPKTKFSVIRNRKQPWLLVKSLTTTLFNAPSSPPTNRANCRPQSHTRREVHPQLYQTRQSRSVSRETPSFPPRTCRRRVPQSQWSAATLDRRVLLLPGVSTSEPVARCDPAGEKPAAPRAAASTRVVMVWSPFRMYTIENVFRLPLRRNPFSTTVLSARSLCFRQASLVDSCSWPHYLVSAPVQIAPILVLNYIFT